MKYVVGAYLILLAVSLTVFFLTVTLEMAFGFRWLGPLVTLSAFTGIFLCTMALFSLLAATAVAAFWS